MNSRLALIFGTLFGGLSVALGAFAAHGLKRTLSVYHLDIFQTGVHYQAIHALALIAVALWMRQIGDVPRTLKLAAAFFTAGILFFSGSLYVLALTGITLFGAVTPVGGVCFLIGWAAAMTAAWRSE
ncbi:DUF423 domain-containing protein [Parasalinivibrio latis]|uniref:DUF423 domain-containing protein n=1 Tax=Parasalinivibrio latis TaxID=2952610 RepID=UPI0030DEA1BD